MPRLQEAKKRNPGEVALYQDCGRCMQSTTAEHRRYLGCGYQPVNPDAMPWDGLPYGRDPGRDELDDRGRLHLPVCPGYVCFLPEVIEVSYAHGFWDKGQLEHFLGSEPCAPLLRDSIAFLDQEYAKALEWSIKNPPPKAK